MHKVSKLSVAALMMIGLVACQKQDAETKDKLEKIALRLEAMDKKLDQAVAGAGAAGRMRPQAPNEPDPKATYAVPIEGATPKGPATAKITIVEAAEYACPFCFRVIPTIDEIQKEYGDQVRVVYRPFVVHPQTAMTPALAACAAGYQGKFWEFHEMVWAGAWEANPQPRMKDVNKLNAETMDAHAKELGLDMDKFKADMNGDKCKNDINGGMAELSKLGVRGTPAFFINGRFLSGAQPLANFKAVIDEEIKKADAAIQGGVKAEDYYKTAVLEKGKKSI